MANDSGSRSGNRGSLRMVSTQALYRELENRRQQAKVLRKTLDTLQNKLTKIEQKIARLGLSPTSSGRQSRIPENWHMMSAKRITLRDTILKAIGSKTMAVREIIETVNKLGYETKSTPDSFRRMVVRELTHNPKFFRRVRRGQYAKAHTLRLAA